MEKRKIFAMHERFGTCGALRCKDCNHLVGGKYHDRQPYKCELYGLTHSEATDWRLSYQACGMFDVEQNMDTWVPILEQIKHESRKANEPPVTGQVDMNTLWSEIRFR